MSENGEEKKFNLELTDFLKKKTKELGMKIKEHKHRLIFCKTNLNWTCNECNSEKSKTEPRLFCSICDYNVYNSCHIILDGFVINAKKSLMERYGHFIVQNVIMTFALIALKMKV